MVKSLPERYPLFDKLGKSFCGDAGFGKTEVAIRSAFRAVMDGKQVAVLVPTTVLAEQHYLTFSQRMADYPVTVEMLSRFRSPAQQKAAIERLQSGEVDIVISCLNKNVILFGADEFAAFGPRKIFMNVSIAPSHEIAALQDWLGLPGMLKTFGRDKGFDIPTRTDYVSALKPLLDAVGTNPNVTVVLFTLDESAYARELAPLAGVYPALRLGPPWWFHDSPEGMRRFRELTTETAGFYNTVGFNDDTRALLSIPARHDVWRREVARFLGTFVAEHRLSASSAAEIARQLAYDAAKLAYRLD